MEADLDSDGARTVGTADSASASRRVLSEDFLRGKLTRTLRAAKAQLDAYPSSAARKIVFVVFAPDESWEEDADGDSRQLRAFLKKHPFAGVDVEFYQFPRPPSASA